jgi:hypothetical protein
MRQSGHARQDAAALRSFGKERVCGGSAIVGVLIRAIMKDELLLRDRHLKPDSNTTADATRVNKANCASWIHR